MTTFGSARGMHAAASGSIRATEEYRAVNGIARLCVEAACKIGRAARRPPLGSMHMPGSNVFDVRNVVSRETQDEGARTEVEHDMQDEETHAVVVDAPGRGPTNEL